MPWASEEHQEELDTDNHVSVYIISVESIVTSHDVDTYDRLSQVQSRSEGLRSERRLRMMYGGALLGLLSGQIIAVTTFVFLIGFGVIQVDRWVTGTFVTGTLGQVSGMAFLVVRYLFPTHGEDAKND